MMYRDRVPDNPWPRGMAIRVDDTPHHLTVLLFIRHAWELAADAEVPRLEPLPHVGTSRIPDSATPAEWEACWRRAWGRAWDWFSVEEPDPTIHPTPGYLREASQPGHGLLPYQGYFARRITARHLAVSAVTRNEPTAYSRALRTAANPGQQPGIAAW